MTAPTIRCPLCRWAYTVPPLPAGIDENTLANVLGTGIVKLQLIHWRAAETECRLRDHFDTHPLPDWVRKVTELQAQIALHKAEIERLREQETPT